MKPVDTVNCDNLIGGVWTKGEAGSHEQLSPVDGRVLGTVTLPSSSQVAKAIELAASAQKAWGLSPPKERAKVLFEFRNILLREADSIASLKSLEAG